jgi:streptogramin lyase
MRVELVFKAPEPHPNGLQFTDEGLWIADQGSDNVALVDPGSGRVLRSMPTESTNTSGVAWGDGALFLSVNGPLKMNARPPVAERGSAQGEILKIDPQSGRTLARYKMAPGQGIHGIERDADSFWVSLPGPRLIAQLDAGDFRTLHTIPVPLKRAHGVARDGDAIWCVHTADRIIVKLAVTDGQERDRITLPDSVPEPHCLALRDGELWYCDAMSGDICRIAR